MNAAPHCKIKVWTLAYDDDVVAGVFPSKAEADAAWRERAEEFWKNRNSGTPPADNEALCADLEADGFTDWGSIEEHDLDLPAASPVATAELCQRAAEYVERFSELAGAPKDSDSFAVLAALRSAAAGGTPATLPPGGDYGPLYEAARAVIAEADSLCDGEEPDSEDVSGDSADDRDLGIAVGWWNAAAKLRAAVNCVNRPTDSVRLACRGLFSAVDHAIKAYCDPDVHIRLGASGFAILDEIIPGLEQAANEAQAANLIPRTNAQKAERALDFLKAARDLLKDAGASDRMVERVKAAISSAKGAVRHARHRDLRATEKDAA